MRFLLKITLAILVLHGIGLGAIIGQQHWSPARVQHVLAIDENCGDACWFGVRYDGHTHYDVVRTTLEEDYGVDDLYFRHSKMSFRVLEDNVEPALGFVEITIEDSYASTVCFVPNQIPGKMITLADVIASFGTPDYFWVDLGSVQYLLRSNIILVDYEMIYESPSMLIQGQIRTADFEDRLPFDTSVELMCTPPVSFREADNQFRPLSQDLPAWNGFNERISSYAPSLLIEDEFGVPIQRSIP